jgi:ubiquinone/menaquinone biosynthesis C-methylase UbiE
MKPSDGVGFRDWRVWATARAQGRVLEIGAGSGPNFSYYLSNAAVIAFDPDPDLFEEFENAGGTIARISLLQASAMELPFPDESFDAAVGTLVFCTIPDPRRALSEVKRVMKRGAPLRLVEHVRARNPIIGGIMDAATPLWKRMAGGCHLNRNTFDTVNAVGFEIITLQERWFGLFIGIDARK